MKSKNFAWISIILAVGAAIYMSFWGVGYAEMDSKTGKIIETRKGVDQPIPLVYLLFPILGLTGIQKKKVRILNAAVISMFLLVVVFFSVIGAVFLPSFLLLLGAAVFHEKETESRNGERGACWN